MRHAFRNAALPTLTILGLLVGATVTGSIVVETVFVLPGLGSLLLSSVARHDLMVVQGIVMLLVLAVLVINALVEVSYVFIDPRLRTRSR